MTKVIARRFDMSKCTLRELNAFLNFGSVATRYNEYMLTNQLPPVEETLKVNMAVLDLLKAMCITDDGSSVEEALYSLTMTEIADLCAKVFVKDEAIDWDTEFNKLVNGDNDDGT